MLKDLVKLANHLDSRGLAKEADYLDAIIRKKLASESPSEKEELERKFESELEDYIDPYENSSLDFDEDLRERRGIFGSDTNLKILTDVATKLRDKFQRQIDDSSSMFGEIDDETFGYVMRLEDVIKDANSSLMKAQG